MSLYGSSALDKVKSRNLDLVDGVRCMASYVWQQRSIRNAKVLKLASFT